jgi:hypothetical protein
LTDIGVPGPLTINDNRVIAGNRDGRFSTTTAFVYDYDTSTTTNIPSHFRAIEINNDGTVVGRGSLSARSNTTKTAMSYASGVRTSLSNRESEATDINNAGQIVGRITDVQPATGFLHTVGIGFWPLDNLLQDNPQDTSLWFSKDPRDNFFQEQQIEAMSEPLSGGYPVIVGYKQVPGFMFSDGVQRRMGFILRPISSAMSSALTVGSVPEPMGAMLFALAILPLVATTRRR